MVELIKVLIVEDNPFMMRMYGRYFQSAGFAVVTANDGIEAVQTATEQRPQIILMDVMMPKQNGLDALKALKADAQTKDIPVVMLSAYEEDDLMQAALQAGANRYLLKGSLEPDAVVAIISEIVAEHRAQAQA